MIGGIEGGDVGRDDREVVEAQALASASMNARWAAELETVTISLLDHRCAAHRQNDPQPHPSSSTRWPSARPARSPYSANMASSAWARVATPSGQWHEEYFRLGPSTWVKKPVGTS